MYLFFFLKSCTIREILKEKGKKWLLYYIRVTVIFLTQFINILIKTTTLQTYSVKTIYNKTQTGQLLITIAYISYLICRP